MFLTGCVFTAVFLLSFFKDIKSELENAFKKRDNEVQILLNDSSSREGLIDDKGNSLSMQLQNEGFWNFKFVIMNSIKISYSSMSKLEVMISTINFLIYFK